MNNENETITVRKPLEEMDVIDNFLFNEIMINEENGTELCRMILSLVLKREIGEASGGWNKETDHQCL